jgi:hypothetical protein
MKRKKPLSTKPLSTKHVREVDDQTEQVQLLSKSTLDIQLASVSDSEVGFFAAHNVNHSILAAKHTGQLMIWEVFSGTIGERKALANRIRTKLTNSVRR